MYYCTSKSLLTRSSRHSIVVNEFVENSNLWLVNSFFIAKQECVFVTQATYVSLQKTMALRGKVSEINIFQSIDKKLLAEWFPTRYVSCVR